MQQEMGACLDYTANSQQSMPVTIEVWQQTCEGCGAMPDAAARKLTGRVLNFVNVVVYVPLPAVNSCYIITIIT